MGWEIWKRVDGDGVACCGAKVRCDGESKCGEYLAARIVCEYVDENATMIPLSCHILSAIKIRLDFSGWEYATLERQWKDLFSNLVSITLAFQGDPLSDTKPRNLDPSPLARSSTYSEHAIDTKAQLCRFLMSSSK